MSQCLTLESDERSDSWEDPAERLYSGRLSCAHCSKLICLFWRSFETWLVKSPSEEGGFLGFVVRVSLEKIVGLLKSSKIVLSSGGGSV